jgi:hypothetical protein
LTFQPQKPLLPPEDEINRQLERLFSSPDFLASPQQKALLKFVVNQSLTGNANRIKSYTVATEVFGREPDFDQSTDPIVSVQDCFDMLCDTPDKAQLLNPRTG